MPEISLFYGIRVTMFYSDHNPPHFTPNTQETRRWWISNPPVYSAARFPPAN